MITVRKSTYKVGDIFKIPLGNGKYGLGRVLIAQNPGILAGFYKMIIESESDIDLHSLENQDYFLRIVCGDLGLKRKEWEIIGNIPIEHNITLPVFWGKDPFTGELYLREYKLNKHDPLGLGGNFNDRPTTKLEIIEKNASPSGLFGWKAAEIKLKSCLDEIERIGPYH